MMELFTQNGEIVASFDHLRWRQGGGNQAMETEYSSRVLRGFVPKLFYLINWSILNCRSTVAYGGWFLGSNSKFAFFKQKISN